MATRLGTLSVCQPGLSDDGMLRWTAQPTPDQDDKIDELLSEPTAAFGGRLQARRALLDHITAALQDKQELDGNELHQLAESIGNDTLTADYRRWYSGFTHTPQAPAAVTAMKIGNGYRMSRSVIPICTLVARRIAPTMPVRAQVADHTATMRVARRPEISTVKSLRVPGVSRRSGCRRCWTARVGAVSAGIIVFGDVSA